MTFSQIAIILSFVLYCVIAVGNLRDRDYPHAMVWGSYGLSQLGFLWYEFTKRPPE
jgi:hypothetical protein